MCSGGIRPERDDLDEVVLRAGCLHERARVRDVHADSRVREYPSREVPIAGADHAHDVRLDLDRVHRPRPGAQRLQHRTPSSGARHQHARMLHQPVGQGGGEILEIRGRRRRGIVPHDRERAVRIDEQGHLLRHRCSGEQAQARCAAKRDLTVLDRTCRAKRAGAGLDQRRAGDPERLRQRLEGRDPQLAGHAEARERQDHATQQQYGPAAPMRRARPGNLLAPDRCTVTATATTSRTAHGKRTRDRPEPAYEVQGPLGRNQIEHSHRRRRPGSGPGKVRRVHPRKLVPEHHQCTSDAGGCEEEGDGQDELDDQQPAERAGGPGRIQHVERYAFDDDEGDRSGQTEPEGADCEEGLGAAPDPMAQHHQKGPARPEAEQGHADRQEGEMVPLHDREQPGQQDLVAERGSREHRHRGQHREAGAWPIPVRVTLAMQHGPPAKLAVAPLSPRRRSGPWRQRRKAR